MIVPHTEWIIPKEYPDLRSADEIAIDLETRDPDLKSKVLEQYQVTVKL